MIIALFLPVRNYADKELKVEVLCENVSLVKDKQFNEVYYFSGENSFATIKDVQIDTTFTISIWINSEILTDKNHAIFGVENKFWIRTTNNRELQFTRPSVYDKNTVGLNLSQNKWYHVTARLRKGLLSLFLDGEKLKDFTWNRDSKFRGELENSFSNKKKYTILLGKDRWQENFVGKIYQPKFYPKALSDETVRLNYNQSAPEMQIEEGALLYLPFDRGLESHFTTLSIQDYSGAEIVSDSIRGNIARFNGHNCFVDYGNMPVDNAITVATWIKPTEISRDFGAVAGFGHSFAFRIGYGGSLLFTIPQFVDIYTKMGIVRNNQWQHIEVTYVQRGDINIYHNGVMVKHLDCDSVQDTDKNLTIGTNLWNDYLKADLDDFIVWDRILTENEINEVYSTSSEELITRIPDYRYVRKKKVIWTVIIVSVLLMILFIIFRQKKVKIDRREAEKKRFLDKINKIVEENIENPEFDVASFTTSVGMSKTKLYNELKKHTDLSISAYVREKRMEKAAELIKENQLSISEIILQVGFESRSYFNKCFKEKYGVTPSQYKVV